MDGSLGKNKLMIFLGPQHGKSDISSRRFPSYVLGKNPDTKIALASYAASLSSSFCMDCQTIMETKEYAEVFPDSMIYTPGRGTQQAKRKADYFEILENSGYYKSVGVGGGLTGFTVDLGIIDDPLKDRKEARSETVRENLWSWYNDVFCTRLHNDSKQLMLFTRWHEDDLAGRVLAAEGDEWEVIAIPTLKEAEKPIPQAIDMPEDPREVDDALWPERHSAERIRKIRETNPATFNSLHQQRPSAAEGDTIKKAWFGIENNFNGSRDYKIDILIDGAYTKNTKNDPTAIMTVAHNKDHAIILNSTTVHLELYELLDYIEEYIETQPFEKRTGRVYIEPKASGLSLKSMLNKKGYNCIEINSKLVKMGKIDRAEDAAPSIHAGKILLLKGAWNAQFLDEVAAFPNGKHDDQLDNLCYAVLMYFVKKKERKGLKRRN